jgi:uncharacterized membrane protein
MKTLKQLLVAIIALMTGGVALAQTTTDPYKERRSEKQEAKKEYKEGDVSKEEYNKKQAESKKKAETARKQEEAAEARKPPGERTSGN